MLKYTIVMLFCIYCSSANNEGEACVKKDGTPGTCMKVKNCSSAIEGLKKKIVPQICSFQGSDPVVCCERGGESPPVVTTTEKNSPHSSDNTDTSIMYDDYELNEKSCEPLPPSLTSPPTGQKAWDKCLEYQDTLVYPCERSVALIGGKQRANKCQRNSEELILSDVPGPYEFSHLVLLGFGEKADEITWLCTGSLISESFVLTVGHCFNSPNFGPVNFALIGALRRPTGPPDPTNLRRISERIRHPNYKPPQRYNDIGLLRLESPVKLSHLLVPACLHVANDTINDQRVIGAGWGFPSRSPSEELRKFTLNKFSEDECTATYSPHRQSSRGIDFNTQVCYGDQSGDTCQGDSGSPLMVKNKKIQCMFTLAALTSYGKSCSLKGVPGVYTRVEPYVSWIESVVWP